MNTFNVPGKIYFKDGSAGVALRELTEIYHYKRVLIITGAASYAGGTASGIMNMLEKNGLSVAEYLVENAPVTTGDLRAAVQKLREFEPDAVIGIGAGEIMNAAKLLRILGENTEIDPCDLAGIEAAAAVYAGGGNRKCMLVLMPTSFGDGAQNTSFAAVSDEEGLHYLKGIRFIPEMTVTDAQFVKGKSPEAVKDEAGQLLGLAVRAFLNNESCEYTDGLLTEAIFSVLRYREAAAAGRPSALEKLHNASTIAGSTFGNIYTDGAELLNSSIPAKDELSEEAAEKLDRLADEYGCSGGTEFMKLLAR